MAALLVRHGLTDPLLEALVRALRAALGHGLRHRLVAAHDNAGAGERDEDLAGAAAVHGLDAELDALVPEHVADLGQSTQLLRDEPAEGRGSGLEGEAVGVVLPQEFSDSEAEGTLFYVAVLPAFRGRGYGRALHATGLAMLAERGVTRYIGSTDTRNKPMLKVFEANGCPQTATQLFYGPPAAPAER